SLSALITDVLSVKRSILYFGPRTMKQVESTILDSFIGQAPIKETPPHEPDRAYKSTSNQIYFVQKEMAQAQVRLECSVGTFDESKTPCAQIYNEYFGGGMAGLVFQELREARALAYSAWAHYFTPARNNEENILVGAIGCQADKTIEALEAFIDLIDNMPINQARWESAHASILSTYRTNPIGSRRIPGFVYDTTTLGLQGDPRQKRYEFIKSMKVKDLQEFYTTEIQPKSLLISVVGDSDSIDIEDLKRFGQVSQFNPEELFNR
ncbi:MAG: insulinase family protein, partial [Opitutales bacterium]|nr:insulinase family protein [Opitutales bacterium]